MSDDVSIRDHYRARSAGERTPGIYRVVGVDDDEVALLRVTTGDDRRVHSGDLACVPRDALDAAFEAAEDPDAGFDPVRGLRGMIDGFVWEFRSIFRI